MIISERTVNMTARTAATSTVVSERIVSRV